MGSSAEPAIQVLHSVWILFEGMNEERRLALLRFWTSLPRLPPGGFAELPQPLVIVRADHSTQRLPQVGGFDAGASAESPSRLETAALAGVCGPPGMRGKAQGCPEPTCSQPAAAQPPPLMLFAGRWA